MVINHITTGRITPQHPNEQLVVYMKKESFL